MKIITGDGVIQIHTYHYKFQIQLIYSLQECKGEAPRVGSLTL